MLKVLGVFFFIIISLLCILKFKKCISSHISYRMRNKALQLTNCESFLEKRFSMKLRINFFDY